MLFFILDFCGRFIHKHFISKPDYNFVTYEKRTISELDSIKEIHQFIEFEYKGEVIKLASTIFLPEKECVLKNGKVPTILCATRYNRSFSVRFPHSVVYGDCLMIEDYNREMIEKVVSNGYCFLIYDVRGTGASTGSRDFDFLPRDKEEFRAVFKWILEQPWSDGRIVTWGISYSGLCSTVMFGMKDLHPNLIASVAEFPPISYYRDVIYPGGCFMHGLWHTYSMYCRDCELMNLKECEAFEVNEAPSYIRFAFKNILNEVTPVNNDLETLYEALQDHQKSKRIVGELRDYQFSDSTPPCLGGKTYDEYTKEMLYPVTCEKPLHFARTFYLIGGWYDTFTESTIETYIQLRKNNEKNNKWLSLTIGPWQHGGVFYSSPFSRPRASSFDFPMEMLRFFDYSLDRSSSKEMKRNGKGFGKANYYIVGREEWTSFAYYPPPTRPMKVFLSECSCSCDQTKFQDECWDFHFINEEFTSTRRSRYNILSQFFHYLDANETKKHFTIDQKKKGYNHQQLLSYRSKVMKETVVITGKIEIHLHLAIDKQDGCVFAFLFDCDANGKDMKIISEGHLRLIHRNEFLNEKESFLSDSAPIFSFSEKRSKKMKPFVADDIVFYLSHISYQLEEGRSFVLFVTGSDKYNFVNHAKKEENAKFFQVHRKKSFIRFPVETRF